MDLRQQHNVRTGVKSAHRRTVGMLRMVFKLHAYIYLCSTQTSSFRLKAAKTFISALTRLFFLGFGGA